MYPISKGYGEVITRLDALSNNGHHAEALLASVFAMEKTVRRSLRYCMLNRGFTSVQCDKLLERKGFKDMTGYWPVFDKEHRSLPDFIGQNTWQHVPKAVKMRNDMVHGARVFNLTECRDATLEVRRALDVLRNQSIAELSCDPWSTLPSKRKSSLPWLAIDQPKTPSK